MVEDSSCVSAPGLRGPGRLDDEAGAIVLAATFGAEADDDAARVQKAKVVKVAVDHTVAAVDVWQAAGKDRGHVAPGRENGCDVGAVGFRAREGQRVVGRQLTGGRREGALG